jgi:tetratricopeptide (TPR) repeat protein
MRFQSILIIFLGLALGAGPVAADVDSDLQRLQHRWAEINYEFEGKTQITAYEELVADAERVTAAYPESAAALIWSGIIKSSFAGAKGGLGAMKLAKASRTDLERALEIDPDALQGSAYTSLGTLYFKVPGWPLGFGDEDKAEELLHKALALNPEGIDPNYFYGDFLIDQKRYAEAEQALLKAQHAAPRPDRPLADAGRQEEIQLALLKVRDKLHP